MQGVSITHDVTEVWSVPIMAETDQYISRSEAVRRYGVKLGMLVSYERRTTTDGRPLLPRYKRGAGTTVFYKVDELERALAFQPAPPSDGEEDGE